MRVRPSKAEYYFLHALTASLRSNCIKRQNGAVITVNDRIVSIGYNGTPRGYLNCDVGGCPRCASDVPSGQSLSECLCIHSEENAIIHAANYGVAVKGGEIFTLISPCLICAKMIINAGIIAVHYLDVYPSPGLKLLYDCNVAAVHHQNIKGSGLAKFAIDSLDKDDLSTDGREGEEARGLLGHSRRTSQKDGD